MVLDSGVRTLRRAGDRDTLDAVLSLVDATLAELGDQWRQLAGTSVPKPGVLHTHSILDLVVNFAGNLGKLIRPRTAHWGPMGWPDFETLG